MLHVLISKLIKSSLNKIIVNYSEYGGPCLAHCTLVLRPNRIPCRSEGPTDMQSCVNAGCCYDSTDSIPNRRCYFAARKYFGIVRNLPLFFKTLPAVYFRSYELQLPWRPVPDSQWKYSNMRKRQRWAEFLQLFRLLLQSSWFELSVLQKRR